MRKFAGEVRGKFADSLSADFGEVRGSPYGRDPQTSLKFADNFAGKSADVRRSQGAGGLESPPAPVRLTRRFSLVAEENRETSAADEREQEQRHAAEMRRQFWQALDGMTLGERLAVLSAAMEREPRRAGIGDGDERD